MPAPEASKKVAASGKKPPRAGMGRPKGSPNKTTALLKDAILKAAQEAGEGDMVKYLRVQAIKNPGPFLSLLGKVLPTQVAGDPENPIHNVHRVELVALKPADDNGSD